MSAVQSISLQSEQKGAEPKGSSKQDSSGNFCMAPLAAEVERQVMEGRKGCSALGKGKHPEHQSLISDIQAEKEGVWE